MKTPTDRHNTCITITDRIQQFREEFSVGDHHCASVLLEYCKFFKQDALLKYKSGGFTTKCIWLKVVGPKNFCTCSEAIEEADELCLHQKLEEL